MQRLFRLCFIVMLSLSPLSSFAILSWDAWLKELRQEAIDDGIRPDIFDKAFEGVTPSHRVVNLDRTQPEKRLTFYEYRKTRIDPYRITLGVNQYKKYRPILEKIGREYGVNPYMIVAFWGIESSYGRFKGDFPVITSLATLAYDGRRSEFFRKELLIALHILNDGHIDLNDFKGEWAGASGHPQFLPSSWRKYAVDYDHDGHKNIWTNLDDVFASIANYMQMNGWQKGQPWGLEVELPNDFNQAYVESEKTLPYSQWVKLGVKIKAGTELPPSQDLEATMIQPYGGPTFLMFKNYHVILQYNNSKFYAASVGYLADSISQKVK